MQLDLYFSSLPSGHERQRQVYTSYLRASGGECLSFWNSLRKCHRARADRSSALAAKFVMAFAFRQGKSFFRNASGSAFRRSFGYQANGFRSSGTPIALSAVAVGCAGGVYYLNKRFKIIPGLQVLPTLAASAPTDERALARERTFIMIKPDGVARGLVAEIIKRFEQRGYKLVAMKLMVPSVELLNQHYADLSARPFFPGLVRHVSSGPVIAMVWEGKNAVAQGRTMLGETDPLKSKPGSIRGDYAIDMGRNVIHGSDSVETAQREIALWFTEKEIHEWALPGQKMVYE